MPESPVNFRVLIADDEVIIADTLALILNLNGFDATAVYSGEQAVETARTLRPDALISDIYMGNMSGIEAAVSIKRILPGCEILLVSGLAGDDMLLHVAALHPSFLVFEKPLDPRILIEVLKAISGSKITGGMEFRPAPGIAQPRLQDAKRTAPLHSDSCLARVGTCSALRAGAY